MRDKNSLHFRRWKPIPTGLEHTVRSSAESIIAIVIEIVFVACIGSFTDERALGPSALIPISFGTQLTFHDQLTKFTPCNSIPIVVD